MNYILSSAVWSLVGIVIGDYLGRTRIRKKIMDDKDSDAPGAAKSHRIQLHKPTMQQIVGAVIVLLALASISLVTYQRTQLKQATACYAQFATDYSDALRARDGDAQRAREDLIAYTVASADLWRGFLAAAPQGQPTPEQRAASLRVLDKYFVSNANYVTSLHAVQEAAKRHPIPANTCRPQL